MRSDPISKKDNAYQIAGSPPAEAHESKQRSWILLSIVFSVIAVLLILSALLWLGESLGLIAALLPGGLGLEEGTFWGSLSFLALFILGLILVSIYRGKTRQP